MIIKPRLLCFVLFICTLFTNNNPVHASYRDTAYYAINEFREVLLDLFSPRQFCGIHDASPEVTDEIKTILRSIHVEDVDSIHIKRLSIIGRRIYGEKNAFVWTYPGFPRFLYISEDWFKTLSPEEKRFIIGHEGMHLKLNHIPARLKAYGLSITGATLSGCGFGYLLHTVIYPNHGKLPSIIGGTYAGFVTLNIFQSFLLKMYREQELEADRESALALQCIEGGCKFFDALQQNEDAIEAELPQRPYLVNMRKQMRLNMTHPTNEARKNALIALKNANN